MARRLTGTDRVAAGTRALPTTAGTLALWWYPEFSQADGLNHSAFYVETTTNTNFFYVNKHAAGFGNRLGAGWTTSGLDCRVLVLPASYTLVQNAWNSLILTWDASGSFLYLNGTLIGSAAAPGTHTTTAVRYLGNSPGAATPGSGRLAEVVICDRVWSARERAAYDAGVLPRRIGPVYDYWPLWGGDSSEQDLSGSGDTGTLTGTTKANHAPVLPSSATWWGSQFVEGAAPPTDWIQNLAETLTLTDGRSLGAARQLTDTLSLLDTRTLGAARSLAETVILADSRSLGAVRLLAETVDLSDAAELALVLLLALTETLALADARTLAAGKGLAEPLTLADGRSIATSLGLAEPIGIAATAGFGAGKGLGEVLALDDAWLLGAGLGLAEPVTFTDARRLELAKALTESLDLTDLLSALIGRELAVALTESLSFADQVAAALVLIETAACYGGSVTLALKLGGTVEWAEQYGGVIEWLVTYGGRVERCGNE
jgi:hypothetical protein